MKISYNWLKEYLDFTIPPMELADIITNLGLEVEEVSEFETVKGGLQGLIVGEVLSVEKHPDADKLKLTKVNVGTGTDLQIVCGANNVAAGQKVVVATDGVEIFPVEGEKIKIKKSKIRGAVSEGMICAEDEIGLGTNHDGIIVLPAETIVGSAVKDFYKIEKDFVFEIGLTPNRGDAFSHIGVARDVFAWMKLNAINCELKIPTSSDLKITGEKKNIQVEIENENSCWRYTGICISNVEVKESPEWLKKKLSSIGVKSINNIVDITNFVLHESGQPLHAFDADEIKGNKVVVKNLAAGNSFITLDVKEIKLNANDLMICNAEEPMCMAGVYGGAKSGVKNSTKNIFLESACFNPSTTRKTSFTHGLRTDAAMHFEKGTDIENTVSVLSRAALLICEMANGKISSEIIDVYPNKFSPKGLLQSEKIISLSWKKLNEISGTEIPADSAKIILTSLGFDLKNETADGCDWEVPSYKTEVLRDVDVIEEVLRIFGYDKIPLPTSIHSSLSYSDKKDSEKLIEHLANYLSANGFSEMMNNSISNSLYTENYFQGEKPETVKLLSFGNVGLDSMRTTMIFGGLEVIAHNQNHKHPNLRLYEFGRTYFKQGDEYKENSHLRLFMSGNANNKTWNMPEKENDFFQLKSLVQNILQKCGVKDWKTETTSNANLAGGIDILVNHSGGMAGTKKIGSVGWVHPKLLKAFEVKRNVFYAEMDSNQLVKINSKKQIKFSELSKFPSVSRDLALVIDENISFGDLKTTAEKSCGKLLKEVSLFDVYTDEKLGAGKKSYAVNFIFVNDSKTLTDTEIDKLMQNLSAQLEKSHGALIRK